MEGIPPRRWRKNAGRLGIDETIRPIICSTMLKGTVLSAWIGRKGSRREKWSRVLELG